MENPHTVLERPTLSFSSYKNRKLKVKRWWVGARERKKRVFFVPFLLFEGIFFNICVLSQCIVYWINFQNIHTFTYQKTLLHTLLLPVFKVVESLQCILNIIKAHSERTSHVINEWSPMVIVILFRSAYVGSQFLTFVTK